MIPLSIKNEYIKSDRNQMNLSKQDVSEVNLMLNRYKTLSGKGKINFTEREF